MSKVGAIFCEWVLAVVAYHGVSRKLDPIRRELAACESEIGVLHEEHKKLREKIKDTADNAK